MSKLSKWIRSIKNDRRRIQISAAAESPLDVYKDFAEATRLGSPSIYSHAAPVDCNLLRFPLAAQHDHAPKLPSCLCTRHQLDSPPFRYWVTQMRENWWLHRKLWEYCYVLQALYERDMLKEGRRGLGFAVGEEPLPALMASMGCTILASDLDSEDDRADVWAETAQLASSLEGLNNRQLCSDALFRERVSFRPIDMNRIPDDVNGFDFTWSSCSFEHCGSIELGKRFIREQMKCLKPGGVAVHTTEYNLSSNEETVEDGTTVIFRRQDVESMIRDLQAEGHEVEPLQLDLGASPEDAYISLFPYSDDVHLKLEMFDKYVSTSVALIIRKAGQSTP